MLLGGKVKIIFHDEGGVGECEEKIMFRGAKPIFFLHYKGGRGVKSPPPPPKTILHHLWTAPNWFKLHPYSGCSHTSYDPPPSRFVHRSSRYSELYPTPSFVNTYCGHFLWTFGVETFGWHFWLTLFVDTFCGHFLWTLFVDTFFLFLPAENYKIFIALSRIMFKSSCKL